MRANPTGAIENLGDSVSCDNETKDLHDEQQDGRRR